MIATEEKGRGYCAAMLTDRNVANGDLSIRMSMGHTFAHLWIWLVDNQPRSAEIELLYYER
jgi:hypothetical protein